MIAVPSPSRRRARVSAKTGEGIDAFRAWLQALLARAPRHRAIAPDCEA